MEAGKIAYRCRCGREVEDAKPGETVTCPDCGIKFALEDGCSKFKILPEIGEDEFVRAAWVHLAKMDVPLDVFERDLGDVETVERCVALDTVRAKVSSKSFASFVSDKFSETDFEAESAACVEIEGAKPAESVSDGEGASLNGEYCDVDSVGFDADMFLESLGGMKNVSFVLPDADERERMKMSQSSRWEADRKHDGDMDEAAKGILTDGECRYEEHSVETVERYTQIFIVSEYRASLIYDGKAYVLAAYPFGDAEVHGGEIENETGARAFEGEKRKTLAAEAERMRESSAAEKRRGNRPLTIAAGSIWCALTLFAIVFGSILVSESFGARHGYIPTGALIACLIIVAVLLVAAIAVTAVDRVLAGRLAMVNSIVEGVKFGVTGDEDSGASGSMRFEEERYTVKALNVAALALWGAFVLAVLAFMVIFAGFDFANGGGLSEDVIIACLIVGGVIFAGAVAVSVVNAVAAYKKRKRIDSRVDELLRSKEEKMESEVEAFAEQCRGELLGALNAKLSSLGMDAATMADLGRTDLEN